MSNAIYFQECPLLAVALNFKNTLWAPGFHLLTK